MSLQAGCLDVTAINYIAWANVDSDGAVTVTDLLLILGAFGQFCG
ncbi:MAG: hypothetical protein O3A35_02580 [Bacteroidetes bacterium]|nr:hypothetical protein [Bacteroidota bacterium]